MTERRKDPSGQAPVAGAPRPLRGVTRAARTPRPPGPEVEEVALQPSRDRGPAAVLWDMDGTLVDTEPYWIETELELAAEHGATWSREQALQLVGNDLIVSGRVIREQMRLELTPEQIVERLLDGVVTRVEREVPWRPGARELIAALHDARVPCALVTMSYTRFVAPILAALPDATFSAIVTGDVVDRGKPHPEPYLTAAHLLGVDPADCVAIEDSGTGAESAAEAGCTVLVVENHVSVPAGPGRVFRDTLVDLTVADVSAVLLAGTDEGAAARRAEE